MELMVPVEGGVVWAEHRGAEGVAVVMLHPGWGDSSIWDGVVTRLPERARTIRFDALGYGRSPAPTGPCTALADLVEVLDRLDIKGRSWWATAQGPPRWALRWLSRNASVH